MALLYSVFIKSEIALGIFNVEEGEHRIDQSIFYYPVIHILKISRKNFNVFVRIHFPFFIYFQIEQNHPFRL